MDKFHDTVFKLVTAKLANNIGFDSINTTSLDVLSSLLEKYLILLGQRTHLAAELRCSTDADITDVSFMLKSLKVAVPDLTEYMQQMEPVPGFEIKKYPVPGTVNLGFTYPNDLDQTPRLPHIPIHYPPLILKSKPDKEEKVEEKKGGDNEKKRRDSFVIVGKHGDDYSSDENPYEPLNIDDESYDSDSSSGKARTLTRPEDIPLFAQGTAASSKLTENEYFNEGDMFDSEPSYRKETKPSVSKINNSSRNIFTTAQNLTKQNSEISMSKHGTSVKKEKEDTNLDRHWLNQYEDRPKLSKTISDDRSSSSSKISFKEIKHKSPYSSKPTLAKSKSYLDSQRSSNYDDDSLKAKMEAAEKLIHSPPPFLSAPIDTKPLSPVLTKEYTPKSPKHKSKVVEKIKHETVNPEFERLVKQSKQMEQNSPAFASPKSMDDAINAVIFRATEEARKADEEARKADEEAELMKFSHLVDSSSSNDSEPDVSQKEEEILQLKSRGLNETKPATPELSPDIDYSDDSPIIPNIPEFPKKEKRSPVHIYTSSEDEIIPEKPRQPSPPIITSSARKKSLDKRSTVPAPKPYKKPEITKTKMFESKPLFFPEDKSTIIKKKKKKHKPISPPVVKSTPKVDKPKISETKVESIKTPKEIKVKSKSKSKEHSHKKHKHSSTPSSSSSSLHVEKLVLKKFKSGSAEVVKKDEVNSPESPISPTPIRNLPLPKLSAAIPVMNISHEKEKKKSKKDKKKKNKDKHSEKKSKIVDTPSPKPDIVPKLTLCMGSNTKNFVVKRESSPPLDYPPVKSLKISKSVTPDVSAAPILPPASPIKREIITQTLSSGPVVDAEGNKIWICPSCNEPDDGSPMIGCDTCDDWYHWPCVGITCEPPENEDWYCPRCLRKRNLAKSSKKLPKKKRKKTLEY